MTEQLKKIAFLVPRSGLSLTAFNRYWRDVHGPLVAGSPGYAAYRRKYVQNHFIDGEPVGEPFPFAGMAEFWLPGDNEDTFATTPVYTERIKVDEANFIEMDGTISMTAAEEIRRPGNGPVKLVRIQRQEGPQTEVPDFARGAVANHVLAGSFRLPGARPVEGAITRVDELWFGTIDEARRGLAALAKGRGWSAFLAREYLFFDDGVPVTPARDPA